MSLTDFVYTPLYPWHPGFAIDYFQDPRNGQLNVTAKLRTDDQRTYRISQVYPVGTELAEQLDYLETALRIMAELDVEEK